MPNFDWIAYVSTVDVVVIDERMNAERFGCLRARNQSISFTSREWIVAAAAGWKKKTPADSKLNYYITYC